ncbi:hypothetical protein PFAG_06140, partial [Plasmodium falciparum Santa Lucia]
RKKKEKKVSEDCKTDYDGCEKNKSGSCANACKAYNQYITNKKEEYDSQKGKFDVEKTEKKQGYEDYSEKQASEYLKEKCIKSSCNCMKKVTEISNYWTNPHTTYDDNSLQKKCSCPPPPCEIVDAILSPQNSSSYAEGCRHKYTTRYAGWECNSGNEDGDICIPPRRQKLYVYELETFNGKTQEDLRQAFIKCAAVETFFSWHEFKKEKEKEKKEKKERDGLYILSSDDNDGPQKQLNGGTIPEEFKRQMFYTFGDYRDICLGKVIGSDMKDLEKNIDKVFKKETPNGQGRKKFWETYRDDIWKGMVCALSYDTKTKIKNEHVYTQLTKSTTYKYETVTFKGGLTVNTKLTEFVTRPQYFRWLEEWGEEFCRKRKHKLEEIDKECAQDGKKKCSGDGEDCQDILNQDYDTVSNLKCPRCAKSCRSYKDWINEKRKEFNKQQEKYKKQIDNVESKYYDNGFYKNPKSTYPTVTNFFESLKDRPCNNKTKDTTINFKDTNKIFGPAEYCSPCSLIGVKCKKVECSNNEQNKCENKKHIDADDIKNSKNPIETVNMLIIDNNTKEFSGDLKGVCETSGIFKGIREDKWSCHSVCNVDICKMKISDDNKNDDEKIILIRALFKRWIENFLKDYNKLNHIISQCMNNGNGSICINDCTNKCKCVAKWIEKKNDEWKSVRERYIKQYNPNDSDNSYSVKNFLEQGLFMEDVNKAIKPFTDLSDFENSNECNDTTNSKSGDPKKNDVVECLLHKLKNKIDTCNRLSSEAERNMCPPQPEDIQNDDIRDTPDIPHGDVAPTFCNVPANPCGEPLATNVVGVEQVAKEIQEQRHKDMLERSGKDGGESQTKGKTGETESALKGDISKATFKDGASPSQLENVCSITKEYTNDRRHGTKAYNGPCTGKDRDIGGVRMKIGTPWKPGSHIQMSAEHIYMPPRRQHMCTSNLEKLDVDYVTKKDNVNDSFLWDVLLAAKMDAQTIKEKYVKQNEKLTLNDENDKRTICRAIRYSFADIGDIIKGTDLWDANGGEITTQKNLVKIFESIKAQLPENKDKYANDKDNKHLKLRADWWEANRKQIWEAMQCPPTTIPPTSYRGANMKCDDTTTTPLDDYVPQRLRWMTEWAEWYCNEQARLYGELMKQCAECKEKGENCQKTCKECKGKCKEYKDFVEKWEKQWKEISKKYKILYEQTKKDTKHSELTKQDQDVVDFLKKLEQANKDNNTIYATAAGYIHQELPNVGCMKQDVFCSGKDNYAFSSKPKEYEKACDCENRENTPVPPPPPPPAPPEDLARSDTSHDGAQSPPDIP